MARPKKQPDHSDRQMLGRGVYVPPWLDAGGFRFMVALDAEGREVFRQRLLSPHDESRITRRLSWFLKIRESWGVVTKPVTAPSTDTALFELLGDVGCTLPKRKGR